MIPLKKLGLNGGGSPLSKLLENSRPASRRVPSVVVPAEPDEYVDYDEPELPPVEPDSALEPTRLRGTLVGGYNRADVDLMLAELRLTIRLLQNDLDALQERSRKVEVELEQKREFEQRHLEMSQSIAQALTHARELEEAALDKAREIEAQAEADAQKARSEAYKQIEEQERQFASLLKLKDDLIGELRSTFTAAADAPVKKKPARKRAATG